MPTTKRFSDETGLPRLRRWSGPEGIYRQVEDLKDRVEQGTRLQEPKVGGDDVPPILYELFSDPNLAHELTFQQCIREMERWYHRLPESQQYAAEVVLEKRLRPSYSVPGPPKPPLKSDPSEVSHALQTRVVAEGVEVVGSADMRGIVLVDVLNASHFSNDPGNWSICGTNEAVYRAVPRGLLLETLDAYPRVGQANSRTEAVSDVLSWLYAHGITAIGQVDGRGRYAIALVRNDDGRMDVVCYDPWSFKRVLDPSFRATPEEVHSGKYPAYREGPYDTRYGTVII